MPALASGRGVSWRPDDTGILVDRVGDSEGCIEVGVKDDVGARVLVGVEFGAMVGAGVDSCWQAANISPAMAIVMAEYRIATMWNIFDERGD